MNFRFHLRHHHPEKEEKPVLPWANWKQWNWYAAEKIFSQYSKQTIPNTCFCAANIFTVLKTWLSNIPNILFLDAVKSTLPNQIFEIFQIYLGCKDIETNPSHLKYVSLEYIWDAVEEISKELSGHECVRCILSIFWSK